jgi:hypothetical protein
MGEKMNLIIANHINMNPFTWSELYYAYEQAKQFRAKNKFSELSVELQIATYKFRWTDKNCYLDNVIVKGKTQ